VPVKMRLWKVEDRALRPLRAEPIDSEELLEDWLVQDISMISDDLLVIGRQLQSGLGGILDILAIDRNGDLAVLELKKDRTPRDVVAQALHYAAWVRTLSWDQIEEIARSHYEGVSLEERFRECFGDSPPDTINTRHRIYVVAAEMDPVSETIVRYLSEEYSATINVVFFKHFTDAEGNRFIGHSWLIDPAEVEDRGDGAGPKRRPALTLEQLEQRAEASGVGPQYRTLMTFFRERASSVRRTRSNIAFVFSLDEGNNAALSLYPEASSEELGLRADVRPEMLAEAFGVDEERIRQGLPDSLAEDEYAYGEIRYFRSVEEAERFIEAVRGS